MRHQLAIPLWDVVSDPEVAFTWRSFRRGLLRSAIWLTIFVAHPWGTSSELIQQVMEKRLCQ